MKFTQEEYDKLPGNGAAAILNRIGEDGQPILKFAQGKFKSGKQCIERYWADEDGKRWKMAHKFIPNKEY